MIDNIIFDLGGVLLELDPERTRKAFVQLGWKEEWRDHQLNGHQVFLDLETGQDAPEVFRKKVKQILPSIVNDSDIDHAWNAMLVDFPSETVHYLESLKSRFRLFLFSNTNELHLKRFGDIFEQKFGYPIAALFEKCYYSHEIGFRKPNPEAFGFVIRDAVLDPSKTLFVDDLKQNTDAAEKAGIHALHIGAGTLLQNLPVYLSGYGLE
jgi:putative hydrolase of the HAD superfamily